MDPKTLRYTRDHEWVALVGSEATIGITEHAERALGDITYIELPKRGTRLVAGRSLGVVESVKAASDILAPVGGVVSEVNTALVKTPEVLNQDAYGAGWICKLTDVDAAQAHALMNSEQYAAFCQQEP